MKHNKKSKTGYFKLILLGIAIFSVSLSARPIHNSYLIDKVGSQTIFISNPEGAEHQGSATGFQVKAPSGRVYTLTNAHVCDLQKDGVLMIKLHSGRSIPRRVIEVYTENDLCLVEGLEGYGGLSLASSYSILDENFVLGFPLGEEMDFSRGYLKGLGTVYILTGIPFEQCKGPRLKPIVVPTLFGPFPMCVLEHQAIKTNIPIFPGNSGSAMVNSFGNVTGVIFASSNQTNWGSAVPLETIKTFLSAY